MRNHRLRVEPVQRQAPARMVPRLVGAVVEHAHQFRHAPHHGDVGFVVDALKKFADVADGVDMFDHAIAARGECLLERLGRTNMPRA